jgi:Uma2 family endonuclease
MNTGTLLTYDDYASLPNDGRRYELLAGVLYEVSAPNLSHQRVSKRLFEQLRLFFEGKRLAEVFYAPLDVILSRHDVAEPDILVVSDPGQFSPRGVEGAPALVVEILSPSNHYYDRDIKAARYLLLGVRHYWIVDPDSKYLACMKADGEHWTTVAQGCDDQQVIDPAWPTLAIALADLWKESPIA